MPHYTNWYGVIADIPNDSNEFWVSYDSEGDLTTVASQIPWTTFIPNSTQPLALSQMAGSMDWQARGIPQPKFLAIMADSAFQNSAATRFKVWDVSCNSIACDTSERNGLVPLDSLVQEATGTANGSIASVYFEIDSVVVIPEPVPSMNVSGAIVLIAFLVGSALLARYWYKGNRRLGPRSTR